MNKKAKLYFERLNGVNGNLFGRLNTYAKENYGYSVMALIRNCKLDVSEGITELQTNTSISAMGDIYELVDLMASNL